MKKQFSPDEAGVLVRNIFLNLGLTGLAVLLFSAIFPNPLIENGLPFLSWFAYIPIFVLLQRVGFGASLFWGAVYGFSAYGLFNYWLTAFHPLAGIIVSSIYLVYMAALFFLLKLAVVFFPRRGYIVQWLIWLAYEYLRTLGFLGYSYGITGYSQWQFIPLIQIADIFGVWGVSALVVFPSAWLAYAFISDQRTENREQRTGKREILAGISSFFLKEKVSAIVWGAALIAALMYGFAVPSDYSAAPHANIALIQHNTDPWKGGIEQYRNNFNTLRRLSDEAITADPLPDLVVWPETAFVPRIFWHQTYRTDQASWLLVRELLEYLSEQDIPFLIGNDDARKDPSINPNPGEDFRVDYNAAMLFENGVNTAVYRKLHLVPFTEHFPYGKQFPRLHRALVNADTHFWEKGAEATVFSLERTDSGPGFTFSAPICFEDTFGYISRMFVQNGAELIVNLSNDAWSESLSAQNQHLSMAVFRAVENRRSMVRSTASGQTCGIAPNGKIIAMAPPFTEAWLTVAVPIVKETTVYTRRGDFSAVCFVLAAILLLIIGGAFYIIRKTVIRR
ncbi:MAG: apolipoprotein N-acyltransferase [Treponema sp.]|nr:apolipoprotein N-acyltransferase [Treponema sp.]